MKQNLMLNKKSPNSKLNFCFDPLPYSLALLSLLCMMTLNFKYNPAPSIWARDNSLSYTIPVFDL